jgi:hypothetical protein
MAPEPSCAIKVRRALAHLQELQRKCGHWAQVQPKLSPCRVVPDPNGAGYSLVKATMPAPPVEEFSTVVGDCVQNLRSSLDHLVFALAEKYSGPLSEEDARTCQFPIVGDDSKKGQAGFGSNTFRDQALARDIKRVSPQAQTIIERLQPYKLAAAYRTHRLWGLSVLSNIDKHRFIHVVSWYSKMMGITPTRGLTPEDFPHGAMGVKIEVYDRLVEGETVIARLPDGFLNILERDEQMNVKIEAGLMVAFNDGDMRGKEVVSELGEIYNYITGTVFQILLPLL